MEDLRAQHRKEQRDLQARITQKKKQATKKTRKGVNDECAALEEELKARQAREISGFRGEGGGGGEEGPGVNGEDGEGGGGEGGDGEGGEGGEGEGEGQGEAQRGNAAPLAASPAAATHPLNASPTSSAAAIPAPPARTDDEQENEKASTTRKPHRQKARLARRTAAHDALAALAASEAATQPDRRAIERAHMQAEFAARGLRELEIRPDGHCLYSAVADQVRLLGIPLAPPRPPTSGSSLQRPRRAEEGAEEDRGKQDNSHVPDYKRVRAAAAQYIQEHADDFTPFVEEPLGEYVRKVRETGEWGGQLELAALAGAYGVEVNVLQGDGRVERIGAGDGQQGQEGEEREEEGKEEKEGGGKGKGRGEIWLVYYRHGFGLGEHYNSLRKMG